LKALGTFTPPEEWEFVKKNMLTENGDLIEMGRLDNGNGMTSGQFISGKKPGFGLKRATSNWGLQLINKYVYGDEAENHD